MASRLEQFQKRKQDLDAKIKVLQEKEVAKKSKDDDRRKFLIGETILRLIEDGELSQSWLDKALDQSLSRKNDRALFGLPEKNAEP